MSEMKNGCSKIKTLLEPYFEGVLPEAQERNLAAHLWQCPRCAAELEQIQRLSLALGALPQIEPARDLLASISARVAALPTPAQRRLSRGWRRLGLTAGLAFALVALVSFGLTLLAPALVVQAKPVLAFFARTSHTLTAWASGSYHSVLITADAAKPLWPAVRAVGLAAAPVIAVYGVAQMLFLAAVAWVIRTRRHRSMVPCHIGTRRS